MKNTILAATFLVASTFAGAAFAGSSFPQSYGPYVGEMKSSDAACGHKGQQACAIPQLENHTSDASSPSASNDSAAYAFSH